MPSTLTNNENWIETKLAEDQQFFAELSKGQAPPYLYIGCSDSRVSPNIITNTDLGEVFVHRNIANQVKNDDPSVTSVIEYAVEALKVQHIIVCGHSACGGVQAAITDEAPSTVHKWIAPIRQLYLENKNSIDAHDGLDNQINALVELNVLAQIESIKSNSSYKKAAEANTAPSLHAWVFELGTGQLKTL